MAMAITPRQYAPRRPECSSRRKRSIPLCLSFGCFIFRRFPKGLAIFKLRGLKLGRGALNKVRAVDTTLFKV